MSLLLQIRKRNFFQMLNAKVLNFSGTQKTGFAHIFQRPSVFIVVNAVFPHNTLSVVHDSSLGAGIFLILLPNRRNNNDYTR